MRKETLDKLKKNYANISGSKTKATALKFHFRYNGINVNLYFDWYDEDCPMLTVVLVKINEGVKGTYFLQGINVREDGWHARYLDDVQPDILGALLKDDKLEDFWNSVDEHLFCNNGYVISDVRQDKYFANILRTKRYSKKKEIRIYLHYPSRTNMQDNHKFDLFNRLGVSMDILNEIQNKGFNLVTTDKPEERVCLKAILEKINIEIE